MRLGYDDLASIHNAEMNFAASYLDDFLIGYFRNSNVESWSWMDDTTGTYEYSPFNQSGNGTLTNTVVEFSGSNSSISRWRAVTSVFSTRFVCSSTF